MRKLSAFFYRFSTLWVALLGLAVFVVFSVLVLPVESARADAFSQGMGGPDTSFFYSGDTLLQMAEVYGEEGRAAFLKARWGFDLAFPLIFTFFFITSISYLFKKGLAGSQSLPLVNLIPLLGFVFDLAENTATSVVMAAYPLRDTWGQFLAPVFTPVKWIFVSISMVLLVIGLLLWLKKGIMRSKLNNK
ncbi:MAG: hypothetical protein CVU43_15915 [Chloroflexi bacterium HGW-Chloroflexi-5]|nr:MAG: hypothetical protein CVU43_15915 [Chloroflexi bacterium HGW-Chloroflexi-5]